MYPLSAPFIVNHIASSSFMNPAVANILYITHEVMVIISIFYFNVTFSVVVANKKAAKKLNCNFTAPPPKKKIILFNVMPSKELSSDDVYILPDPKFYLRVQQLQCILEKLG